MGMSKKDRALFEKYLGMLQSSITKAEQPNRYEGMLGGEFDELTDYFKKGDFQSLPKGQTVDLLPLANYKRMLSYGQPGQGTVAKGGANQLARDNMNQLSNDQLTRDWGQAYEQQIGNLRGRKDDLASLLMGVGNTRSQNNVGNYSQLLSAFNSKSQKQGGGFWSSLLQGAAGAALSFI